jgi:large subunit ribosomal protein L9
VEVILLTDVDKLGLRGDVVDVKRGYARNFLLPRRLAEPATQGKLADLRRRDELRARQEARTFEQGQQVAEALRGTELRFDVKAGPTGALFGSVTPTDIVDELWKLKRIRVDRRKVGLSEPIKRIGRYDVPVEVFTDVTAEVRALVVPEGGELPSEEELAAAEAAEAEAAAPEAAAAEDVAAEDVAAEPAELAEAGGEPETAAVESRGPEPGAPEASA